MCTSCICVTAWVTWNITCSHNSEASDNNSDMFQQSRHACRIHYHVMMRVLVVNILLSVSRIVNQECLNDALIPHRWNETMYLINITLT